ncbi:MAG: thioredoxin family protein [Proteobacteria bacterium]|nr:thioredoxin family protein [Pseudomonadota bacterium]
MSESKNLLLVSPGCPHCHAMQALLQQLQQQNRLTSVEVIDISLQPQVAEKYGVRSVPWLRLGELEFAGSHSLAELEPWLPGVASATLADYFAHLLKAGNLAQVTDRIRREPESLSALVKLLAEAETPITVQLGIGAAMESLEGSSALAQQTTALAALIDSDEPRIRADVCHYLGLTGNRAALPALETCLQDDHADVREIAQESIEALGQ